MSVSIGLPLANAQARYLGVRSISPANITQETLDEIAEAVAVGPQVDVLDQELHMGEDGLVVYDPRAQYTAMFVARTYVADFKSASIARLKDNHRLAALLAIAMVPSSSSSSMSSPQYDYGDGGHRNSTSAEGSKWVAHVVLVEQTMLERLMQIGMATVRRKAAAKAARDGLMLGPDESMTVILERGATGYGFVFSTNMDQYVDGVNHYVSTVDAGGPAHSAGLRSGHRLLYVNGRDIRSFSHDMVIRLIGSFAGINRLCLIVQGANGIIRESLRQKERKLALSKNRPMTAQMVAPETHRRELHRFKPLPAVLEPYTIVERDPIEVETILAPISWHDLESSIKHFSENFRIPSWVPSFNLVDENRKVEDLAHFKNVQGNISRTLAVAICTDVVVFTEWTSNANYLLIARPTPRNNVTAKITNDPTTFIVYLSPKKFYVLEASSSLEALEWAQLLTNPAAKPYVPEPASENFASEQSEVQSTASLPPDHVSDKTTASDSGTDQVALSEHHITEEVAMESYPHQDEGNDDGDMHIVTSVDSPADTKLSSTRTQEEYGRNGEEIEDDSIIAEEDLSRDTVVPVDESGSDEYSQEEQHVDSVVPTQPESRRSSISPVVAESVYSFDAPIKPREDDFAEVTKVPVQEDDSWLQRTQTQQNEVSLELIADGHNGAFSYINGCYIVVDRQDVTGRPCYRHTVTEVKYPGSDEPLPLYLYYHAENKAWAIGPELNSDNVLAFCSSSAKLPEQATTGWIFLTDPNATSHTVDKDFVLVPGED